MNFQEFEEIFKDCEIEGDKVLLKSPMHDAVRFVKETYGFNMLKEIIAADKGEGETELIYHLYSVEDEEDLYMSTIVKDEAASVTDLYDSAKADENEIFDMFGIRFIGNENLKRLYMPEDWKGAPLRKDYVQDDTRLAWNDRT